MAHWFATYPGLSIIGADYLYTEGVDPSTALIYCAPQTGYPATRGNLVFSDGTDSITISDMAVQQPNFEFAEEESHGPGFRWMVRLVDRRYQWHRGAYSAEWNRRTDDRKIWQPSTGQRDARTIAADLLTFMGEVGFDVSEVPNTIFPWVRWFNMTPALCLADLLARISFRCVLKISDNLVKLFADQSGNGLPIGGAQRHAVADWIPGDKPANIRIECGPTRYSSLFKCAAVGYDTDGSIKKIDSLSYVPAGGFANQHPYSFGGVAAASRDFAHNSVYRNYQIETYATGDLEEGPIILTDIGRVVVPPHDSTLLPDADLPRDAESNLNAVLDENVNFPAAVYGRFEQGSYEGGDGARQADATDGGQTPFLYNYEFRFDARNRMLIFPRQMINRSAAAPYVYNEADIWIQLGHYVLDPSNQPVRYFLQRAVAGGNGPDEVVRLDDLFLLVKGSWTAEDSAAGWTYNGSSTNQTALDVELNLYLDELIKFYAGVKADITYLGIVPLDLTGQIHQVHYQIGAGREPKTRGWQGFEGQINTLQGPRRRRSDRRGDQLWEEGQYASP